MYLTLPAARRVLQPQGPLHLAPRFACDGAWAFVPGVSPVSAGGQFAISPPAVVANDIGLGITSGHVGYFNRWVGKTANTGTIVFIQKPTDYWNTDALAFERQYAYVDGVVRFYGGNWNLLLSGTYFGLSGFTGDQTNKTHFVAFSHNGSEYRSAWSGAGQSGFAISSGTKWFNDGGFDGAGYDAFGLNCGATGTRNAGTLHLAAYLPNLVLSDAELVSIRDNPWQLFTGPQWLYTGMGSGSWTPLQVEVGD